ncbi:MAG: KR domain-containing protein, partial [bacterium]|nr:KR domain-containing protein [bacterium]
MQAGQGGYSDAWRLPTSGSWPYVVFGLRLLAILRLGSPCGRIVGTTFLGPTLWRSPAGSAADQDGTEEDTAHEQYCRADHEALVGKAPASGTAAQARERTETPGSDPSPIARSRAPAPVLQPGTSVVSQPAGARELRLQPLLCPASQRPTRGAGPGGNAQALEELGAEVLVLRADVGDQAAMRGVVDQIRQRFGALHGVFHAAGVPGGGVIQRKTPEEAA